MPSPHSCIIVDDDEIDRLTTLSLVKKYPLLQVIGMYESAEEAIQNTNQQPPAIAFLDVDMPGMNGLELRRKLSNIPACIFITSYPDYAVESFELAALDFLVKPVKPERFAKTAERINEYFMLKEKAQLLEHSLGGNTIFIKEGHEQIKLSLHEIIYLEALKDFTQVVTANRKYCVLSSLGNLLKETAFSSFIRIHKSYAVQKHFIEKIKAQELLVQGHLLPVGRAYKSNLDNLQ